MKASIKTNQEKIQDNQQQIWVAIRVCEENMEGMANAIWS
jgi:hypothetical protein